MGVLMFHSNGILDWIIDDLVISHTNDSGAFFFDDNINGSSG